MAKVIAKSDTHAGLRDQLNAALKAKHGPASAYTYDDPSVNDVTDDKVIHTLAGHEKRGKLYASPYKKGDNGVTLGDPKEVEQAYKPLSESGRQRVFEATAFTEAAGTKAFDAKTGTLTITIIKEGFNTSKTKFYSKKALRETGGIFAGAKMFANHQTTAEEKARPEGRVQDWVASISKESPWLESDGRLRSKAIVHDADFKKKLTGLQEAGLLGEMGVSIRAFGGGTPAEVGGYKTTFVESFLGCKSVDFVTFPGAGGKVDMLESDGQHYLTAEELVTYFEEDAATDLDLISLEKLKESRPDLVASIQTEVRETIMAEKTVEQLTTELKEAQEKATALTTENTQLKEAGAKSTVQTELDKQLKESGLPEPAQKKLREQFKEATKVDGIKEAITAEAEYLKGFGVEAGKKGVRGMGEHQESTSNTDAAKVRADMVKSFVESGMSKELAEQTANDRFGTV